MSLSGGDIEEIRVGGRNAPFEDTLWRISDDDPAVLLRFTDGVTPEPRRPLVGEWARNDDRSLDGNWWLWRPFGSGKDTARRRRCGRYELSFLVPVERKLRVTVYSQRVLEEIEYDRMIEEIEAVFPGSVWDSPEHSPSRGSYRTADEPQRRAVPTSLLGAVAEELAAARRIVRRLSWELAPPLPGRPAPPGAGPTRTFDVVENRIALSWARKRARQLSVCGSLVSEASATLTQYIDSVARARGVLPTEAWVEAQHVHVRRLEMLARSLADTAGAVRRVEAALVELDVRGDWKMTPAVRRQPDPNRLAVAHLETGNWAEVQAVRLAMAPFLTTASLFELWAALELVRALEALGFVTLGSPEVVAVASDVMPGLPTRAQWTFVRGDTRLRLYLLPTARRFATRLAPNHPWASAGLSCLDAVSVNAVEHGHRSLFVGFGDSIEPDYALVLASGGREVACVGDALFSDTTLDSAAGSIRDKLIKIRRTYARKIGWIDAWGRLCPCVPTACFAIVPRALDSRALKLTEEEQEIRLLVLAPHTDDAARGRARAMLRGLLDNLEWHLAHRLPLPVQATPQGGEEPLDEDSTHFRTPSRIRPVL